MKLEEQIINRKVVFQGRYVRTEVLTVRLPDGNEAVREIVSPPNAVGILPIDASGNVYLVRQYRTALERVILEIPAGVLENDERPEETGIRECQEEVGVIPQRMVPLCSFYHSVGFSTGRIHLFLATGLTLSPKHHLPEGEFLERVVIPFEELYRMAVSGEIVDSKTLVAALWYRQRLER